MEVRIVLSLPSRGNPLVIDNKVNRERGTFKLNIDVKSSIDQQEFKEVYNNIVKINI